MQLYQTQFLRVLSGSYQNTKKQLQPLSTVRGVPSAATQHGDCGTPATGPGFGGRNQSTRDQGTRGGTSSGGCRFIFGYVCWGVPATAAPAAWSACAGRAGSTYRTALSEPQSIFVVSMPATRMVYSVSKRIGTMGTTSSVLHLKSSSL